MTETAWKSGIRRGSPRWPTRISVWTEPGRWIDPDDATARRSPSIDRRRRPRAPAAPRAEQPLGERRRRPDRRGRRRRRASPGRVERRARRCRADRRRVEALDRLARPAGRPVVRRLRRVDRVDECLLGPAPRIGPRLEQVVQALVAKALDLVGREGRAEQDLGEQLEGRPEAGRPGRRRRRSAHPSRPRRGARRRAVRRPRPARSRRSARCPRSGRGPRGPCRRPRRRLLGGAAGRRPADADTSGRPGRSATRIVRPLSSWSLDTAGNSYGAGCPGCGRSATTGPSRSGRRGGHAASSSSARRRSSLVGQRLVRRSRLGQIGQDEPVVGPEHGRGDLADRLRRDRR